MTEQQRSLEGGDVIENSITSCDKVNQILSKSQPADQHSETVTHVEIIEEEQIYFENIKMVKIIEILISA